jgi:hypothetical protein
MKVIRTTEGYMIEKDDGDYLCDQHGDNTWETRAEADEVLALRLGYEHFIQVRVIDVYGKKVVYPVCDKAKVFAAIADTKTLTESTLRCIRKLGYDINVIANEQPTLGL